MRSDEYMERIILQDLETFKRKANLASEAVKEYVQSVENKVFQCVTYNLQNQYEELQDLLQQSCRTLDRVVIGLAGMVPCLDNNLSRPIEDLARKMITLDRVPSAQWSSSDSSSLRIDNERNSSSNSQSSPSPDIVEGNRGAMVEPSSSSASSSSSATPFGERMMEILRKQRMRSSMDEDEFAIEIPKPSVRLNVDAPEFKPSVFRSVDSNSSFAQTSSCSQTPTSSDAGTTMRNHCTSATHTEKRSDPLGDLQPSVRQTTLETNGRISGEHSNLPQTITSSSSVESFATASAIDRDQNRDDERNSMQEMNGGLEIASPGGFAAGDDVDRLLPYTDGVECRPSSLSTRNVIHDTARVLRGTAEALLEQATNEFAGEAELRLPSRHAQKNCVDRPSSDDFQDTRAGREMIEELADGRDRGTRRGVLFDALKKPESPSEAGDQRLEEALAHWASRRTPDESPCDVRKSRVPPLWNYVHVSISEIDVESGKVYVQMLADEYVISRLSEKMDALSSSTGMSMENIANGLHVIAPFQGVRYRAQIVSKGSADNIEVFFIDYGNKARVELQDLSLMSNKRHIKTCKMAIPCVLDGALMSIPNLLNGLPETAYVCLADPFESDGETMYRIMDMMSSTNENYQELPDPVIFNAVSDPGVFPYKVVISHATSPAAVWLVETKHLEVSEKIEEILVKLPPEQCSRELVTKSVYIAYRDQRAMVVDIREDRCDLRLLDTGKLVEGVPLSACRRLPLLAHMMPGAAALTSLANCELPDHKSSLAEKMMASHIGRTFDMKMKSHENDEVILVDPSTRKYLVKELKEENGFEQQ